MTDPIAPNRARLMAIRSRLLQLEAEPQSLSAAEAILQIRLEPHDFHRIHELVIRNQIDMVLPEERGELEHFRQLGYLLDLLHSRARHALRSV